MTAQPIKEYVKPPNQLRLSDAELEEELACALSSGNPDAPSNIARFVPKDNAFKACPSPVSPFTDARFNPQGNAGAESCLGELSAKNVYRHRPAAAGSCAAIYVG